MLDRSLLEQIVESYRHLIYLVPNLPITQIKKGALTTAAANGNLADVESLLTAKKADINETIIISQEHAFHLEPTPLYVAALFGHLETVDFLIARGAKIDEDVFRSAMCSPKENHRLKIICLLLDSLGTTDQKTAPTINTLLRIAADKFCPEVVRLLIQRGADTTCMEGNKHDPILKHLLEYAIYIISKPDLLKSVLIELARGGCNIAQEYILTYIDESIKHAKKNISATRETISAAKKYHRQSEAQFFTDKLNIYLLQETTLVETRKLLLDEVQSYNKERKQLLTQFFSHPSYKLKSLVDIVEEYVSSKPGDDHSSCNEENPQNKRSTKLG